MNSSKKIIEKLNERRNFYLKDLEECDERGLHGKSLHYSAIIEELNLILGHNHKWKTYKDWRLCGTCRKLEEIIT